MENQNNPNCKYCQSQNVRKYGLVKGVQRYYCNDCERKFVSGSTIPKMQYPTSKIADALYMYYEGLSERDIRHKFIIDNDYVSTGSLYNWVNRFTDLATKEADNYTPKVGDTWIADETYLRVDKSKANIDNPYDKSRKAKWVVFWDIIDSESRFLLASHITTTRGTQDAKALMEKAAKRAGKLPKVVVTDKLKAYLDGIEMAYGADTQHKQGEPFTVENNTNLIERFHGSLKDRTKVMRALKNRTTLQKFTDGWLVYYNFFRPHMGIKDKTPAQEAGIKFPFKNWKEVIEQPYHVTARIRIEPRKPRTSRSMPRITPKTPPLK
jgi:putative transposase